MSPSCALEGSDARLWMATTLTSVYDECLGRGRFHSGAKPAQLNGCVAFTSTHDVVEGVVTRAFGRLADERPGDVALGGHQIQVVEVTKERESSLSGSFEKLGVKSVGLIVGQLAVMVGEGL
jgi:hypothetical protein